MSADSMPFTARAAPEPSRLAGDLWGGFSAMLVALPSSIAYGIAVFAPLGPGYVAQGANAGIIGAMVLGVVAPLLGGAPRLISAPCAPAAAVLAALGLQLLGDAAVPPTQVAAWLALVALFAGLLQLGYGAVGAGRLIKFIPYPVVSGYLSAVGLSIFATQLPKFLGFAGSAKWREVIAVQQWRPEAVAIGSATIAGVLLGPRLTKRVPAPILGLGAGAVAFGLCAWRDPAWLRLDENPLIVGRIRLGTSELAAGIAAQWHAVSGLRWADLAHLALPALMLSVLLSVDTLKTCVVLDALTLGRHDSNRELRGQGVGNFASALMGGMPGAGTMGATLVSRESGGTTRLAGVVAGASVLAALLLAARWLAWLPVPALAGLLMVVAVRMVDWHSVALLRQPSTWLDFGVVAAVVVVAANSNLIAAASAGLALAILLFIREQIRAGVIRWRCHGADLFSKQHRLAPEQAVLLRCGAETTICELQGSLFFGTTDQLRTELEDDLARARFLILDLRRVRSIDFTGVHMLEQFEAMLRAHGGRLLFSRVPANLPSGQNLTHYFATRAAAPDSVVRRFETLDDALRWTEDQILDRELPHRARRDDLLALAEVDLLRGLDGAGGLAVLAACATERHVAPGEKVFPCGEHGDELFLVRKGTVRMTLPLKDGSYHNLAFFGRGDFFGEMAFLDGDVRSADAIATEPLDLFVISRARFDAACRTAGIGAAFFERLARALARRLRQADAEVRALYET